LQELFFEAACHKMSQNNSRKSNFRKMFQGFHKSEKDSRLMTDVAVFITIFLLLD
jgi:hypothetical protein